MLRGITRRHNHSSGSLPCTKDYQGRCKQELEALLPFCRQFYGAANRHDWTDDAGDDHIDHDVLQAEGEEQGVMPALYALAQHAAVADVGSQVRPWLLSWTTRTSGAHLSLAPRATPSGPVPESSSTRAKPASGKPLAREPSNLSAIRPQQGGEVWVGAWSSPPEHQGLVVLSASRCSPRIRSFCAAAAAGTVPPAEHLAAAHPGYDELGRTRSAPYQAAGGNGYE